MTLPPPFSLQLREFSLICSEIAHIPGLFSLL
jgi:hypothetical protein